MIDRKKILIRETQDRKQSFIDNGLEDSKLRVSGSGFGGADGTLGHDHVRAELGYADDNSIY